MFGWNISYRLFGPTTVHLSHEFYLLISLSMLEYGSIRDVRYTLLASLWLSRNLLVRWLVVTCDRYTSVNERTVPLLFSAWRPLRSGRCQLNPIANIIDFITSTVLAGQIFDRPSSYVVSKFIGTNHHYHYHHTTADDHIMMAENDLSSVLNNSGINNSTGIGGNNNNIPNNSLSSSSSRHNRRGGGGSHGKNNHHNNNKQNHINDHSNSFLDSLKKVNDWFQVKFHEVRNIFPSSLAVATSEVYWNTLIAAYTPSLQLILPIGTLLFLYFCKVCLFTNYHTDSTDSTSSRYNNDLYVVGDFNYNNNVRNGNFGNSLMRYLGVIYGDLIYLLKDIEYFSYGTTSTRNNGNGSGGFPFVTNHALQMEAMKDSSSIEYSGGFLHDTTKPFGLYQRSYPPSWMECFYYIMIPATLLGILLFGRVILLPIPDLVAGSSNIVQSLRDYSKKQALSSSSVMSATLSGVVGGGIIIGGGSGSGSGNKGSSSGGNKGSSRNSNSKGGGGGGGAITFLSDIQSGENRRDHKPWLEQYQSIIQEHRFKLICKITLIRVIENVFICAILPRTEFACKTTGQCANKSGLLELTKVMFFQGITSPLRNDFYQGSNSNSNNNNNGAGEKPFSVGENVLRPDTMIGIMIGISVVVITLSLLSAQAATLNRSHLGITGYLAGGWIIVDDDDDNNNNPDNESSLLNNNKKKTNNKDSSISTLQQLQQQQKEQQPSEWEPRKRYKKGDIVKYGRGAGTIYKATTNNPEGVPYDLFLRSTYKLFRNELGHPATSRVVAFVSTIQFGLISTLILLILIYQLVLELDDNSTTPLLWTLAANLIAVYGTVSIAVPNYNEFDQLATSIFD